MGFSEDLAELFTNPGLIAKAAAAGMGQWAPQVGNNLYMKPGPRLAALGDVLLSAREGAEQKATAEEMAQLAQGGGGGIPMPPTAGGRPAPQEGAVAAQAPVSSPQPAMPPGMSRAAMMAQLSPKAWRAMGQNRLLAANVDTLAGAHEKQQQMTAAYQAALPYFTATYGPEKGPEMARALAMSGEKLTAAQIGQPMEAVEAQRVEAQQGLQRVREEKAFTDELRAMNINPLNPADFAKIDGLTTRYPLVNPIKAFGGNVPAALAYMDQRMQGIRKAARESYGYDLLPTIESDEKGNLKMKVAPMDAKAGFGAVREVAQQHADHLTRMVKEGVIDARFVEGQVLALNGALKTGDDIMLRDAIHNAGVLLATIFKANSDSTLMFGAEKRKFLTESRMEQMKLRSMMAADHDIMIAEREIAAGRPVSNPLALQKKEQYEQLLRDNEQMRLQVLLAASPSEYERAIAGAAANRMSAAPTPPAITGPGGGLSWEQEKQRLIKSGKLDPNNPALIEAARQYWLRSTGRQ